MIKILYGFSYLILFDYCVVARNYNISLLLLFMIAHIYPKREEYPFYFVFLVALLANTNVHSFGISVALTFLFYRDILKWDISSGRNRVLFFLPAIGILAAVCQLISPSDNIHSGLFQYHAFSAPFYALINGFTSTLMWPLVFKILVFVLLLSVVYYFLRLLRKDEDADIVFILSFSYAWLFYIFIFKHFGFFRHHVFLLNVFVFCLWIHINKKTTIHQRLLPVLIPLALCLLISVIHAGIIFKKEINLPFSGSLAVANYIKQNGLEKRTIVAYRAPHASSVLPYFKTLKFWYPDIRKFGTFVTWNSEYGRNQELKLEDILQRVKKAGLKDGIFLFNRKISISRCKQYNLTLLFKIENAFGYGDENFYLYKTPN